MKVFYRNILILIIVLLISSCGGTSSSSSSNSNSSSSHEQTYLNTNQTDSLDLDTDFSNKNFIYEGIGEVRLSSCIDGDTAGFYVGNDNIRVRFLGIDTPESTGKIDPWGKPASNFTCNKLTSASSIVLESEIDIFGKFDSSGGRYLSWVWYKNDSSDKYRLLNLELLEEAYTKNNLFTASKYLSYFRAAEENARYSYRRVYGENDPDYDYSGEAKEISIYELVNNFSYYGSVAGSDSSGYRLRLEVMVVRLIGDSLFVRDVYPSLNEETGEYEYGGIYAYAGYSSGLASSVKLGYIIKFYCRATTFNGSIQLSDLKTSQIGKEKLEIISKDNTFEPEIIDSNTELEKYFGKLVQSNIEITNIGEKDDNGNYTIYGKIVGTSKTLNIRVNSEVNPKYQSDYFIIGEKYIVTGGLVKYYDEYQILLGNNDGLEYKDAQKIE